MSSDANDELARTATAHDSQPDPGPGQAREGDTIGRYRLERTLGVGGMGVVHVAFDPDLERRVALKVLRAATGEEAAKRLQREARAMARLNHPNVVTVHEVGSVSGRDYVAMELIDGESLAEWLRAERRDPRAIVDSFIAAGRGLAAAHAAGIVHRDFKPHNVLRSRNGRIAVTDFGLAREAQDPLAVTMPLTGTKDQTSTSSNTPSSLSGLTMSGSVLGTPAYMAPEQWEGGEVTPATDQFGFCVALWEALSGERPYRGPTVDDLRAQVAAGPQALDASKIPRRLRSVLRRGLDPDRAKRWSSMDALLAELSRAQRQRWMLFAALGAGAIAATILVIVLSGGSSDSSCPAPVLDPDVVWNEDVNAAVIAARQVPASKLLAADHRRWLEQRKTACGFEPGHRIAVLGCLDGVLARFDAAARGATKPGQAVLDVGAELVDPAVCRLTTVPRLVTMTSSHFQEVVAARMRDRIRYDQPDEAALVALAERVAVDPCAEAIAQAMLTQIVTEPAARDRAVDLADQAADRCGDDRIRAELAITSVSRALQTEWIGTSYAGKLARAESAVQRVAQADLNARLSEVRMLAESRAQRVDSALEQGQAAVAGYASRGRVEPEIRAGIRMLMIRQGRASPEDLAAIASSLRSWRALALAELGADHDVVRHIDMVEAGWAWSNGDVAGGHQRLAALRRTLPNKDARSISGIVVDAAGAPVPGALVAAGAQFSGDSISIVLPYSDNVGSLRTTTTGPDGKFTISDAVPRGFVVAQSAALRSDAVEIAESVKLEVRPTSRVTGRVDLRGLPASRVVVAVSRHSAATLIDYGVAAPVTRDGTFTLDGVPRGQVDLTVMVDAIDAGSNMIVKRLDITEPVVANLELAVPAAQRNVRVLVRSTVGTPPQNAQVMIIPSVRPAKSMLKELQTQFGDIGGFNIMLARPLEARSEAGLGKPGDLVALVSVPDGLQSACAVGLPAILDQTLQTTAAAHGDKIEVRCVQIADGVSEVVVEVPPWPRFD